MSFYISKLEVGREHKEIEQRCKHGISKVSLAECSLCFLERPELLYKKEKLLKEYGKNYKPLIIPEEESGFGC
jgi:hypothetical protein